VPRLINVICDRALLGAYSQESRIITKRLIKRAAAEVSGELDSPPVMSRMAMAVGLLGIVVVIASIWFIFRNLEPVALPTPVIEAPVATATKPQPAESSSEIVVAPETPQATLSEELALASELTTPDFALTSLFDLWGLHYTRGPQSGCSQAAAAGLACLNQRSSWNGLRQLNRPAVLTVIDDDGNSHELVLTAIQGDSAELSIGGVAVTHPVSEVTELWFGEFLLLWRPPGGAPASLSPGSRGAKVVWLRHSLASIDDRYASDNIDGDEYDANLQSVVRAFQRDHRLVVDGLAGQQTLIIINSLLESDGSPRLTTSGLAEE
jgi:general secretion pathway protein A